MGLLSRENKAFILTIFTVFSLTAVNVVSLAREGDESEFSLVVDKENSALRLPASIPLLGLSEEVKKTVKKIQIHHLSFDLCDKGKSLKNQLVVSADYIQIKGKNCNGEKAIGEIEIINRSNGYTASLFSFQKDQFKTDLIQLSPGLNELTFRFQNSRREWVEDKIQFNNELKL